MHTRAEKMKNILFTSMYIYRLNSTPTYTLKWVY